MEQGLQVAGKATTLVDFRKDVQPIKNSM